MHQHLNFNSKGAPLSEPETLQEAPQKKANDPETDLRVCVSACMHVHVLWRGVANNGLM